MTAAEYCTVIGLGCFSIAGARSSAR